MSPSPSPNAGKAFRHIVDRRRERGNLGVQSQKKAPEPAKRVSLAPLSILETSIDLVDGYYGHKADTAARRLGLVPERSNEAPRAAMNRIAKEYGYEPA